MRELTDEQREAAIASSDNVIGFGRFAERNQQVFLSRSYKAPWGSGGAA